MIVLVSISGDGWQFQEYLEVDTSMDRMWQYEGAFGQLVADRRVERSMYSFIQYLEEQGVTGRVVTPHAEGTIHL